MILTFAIASENKELDLKINEKQIIRDTLSILQKTGYMPETLDINELKVGSARQKKPILCKKSYEEAEIYNGDILYIK
ncbi:MAG: hypothetical protein QM697_09920 [Lachnospiraceae bacterium]